MLIAKLKLKLGPEQSPSKCEKVIVALSWFCFWPQLH